MAGGGGPYVNVESSHVEAGVAVEDGVHQSARARDQRRLRKNTGTER